MDINTLLDAIISDLTNSSLSRVNDLNNQNNINQYVLMLLDKNTHAISWTQSEQNNAEKIIHIANILYNNTSAYTTLLDDGIYDQLLQAYKNYNVNYLVGAEPLTFKEQVNTDLQDNKQLLYNLIDKDKINGTLYGQDIYNQEVPFNQRRKHLLYIVQQEAINKRLINTEHKYPQLVGTLDKCKFVLNNDARNAGAENNPNVQIFERDFIHECLRRGIIGPDEKFTMVAELKYDGVSVEAEVKGDRIITALSRGDTGNNIASDLTPILKGYPFYMAREVPTNENFGIKFEAVITKRNLERLCEIRSRGYRNGRNAIIGLLGSSDAHRYIDMITLIPISCNLDFSEYGHLARLAELNFLNKYYHTGEINRHVVLHGNYQEILFQVKSFMESAIAIRPTLPYMIDGIVVSFVDPEKINKLGRVNSVNKYQMAIKFNPNMARTTFLNYTYTIGKTGIITPIMHFKPVEFNGTIHTKQTVHSLQRFNELDLVSGQEVDITYTNDVLTYVTKSQTEYNIMLQNTQEPVPFITNCPYCGAPVVVSPSGKSAKCSNMHCHERLIMRMVSMMRTLGFVDISEQTIRDLDKQLGGFYGFNHLIKDYDRQKLASIIGPLTAEKFIYYQKQLICSPLYDYKIMNALGFDDIGELTWKLILTHYDLKTLIGCTPEQLHTLLSKIKNVGPLLINSIIEGFNNYKTELDYIIRMPSLIYSYNPNEIMDKPRVVITGFRDDKIVQDLNDLGFDCDPSYGVTKNTVLVIAENPSAKSAKISKAKKYLIPVMSVAEYMDGDIKHFIYLTKNYGPNPMKIFRI